MGMDRFGGGGAGRLRPGRRAAGLTAAARARWRTRSGGVSRHEPDRGAGNRSVGGLSRGAAAKIDSAGLRFVTVNAGVSGETSAGARRRIDWLLREPAAVLVIETGANDGLRGLDVDSLAANIQAIIDRARQQSPPPRIVLVGMEAPPNFGFGYVRRFRAVYPEVAKRNRLPLVPFLLEGVAGVDSLNQADMLHPTPAGQRRVAETVWPVLEKVLKGTG